MNELTYIRYSVGFVFIISGLMKFFSEELSNTFISLGLPYPIYFMYVVTLVEIVCGHLIATNKHVRNASIPLILIMIAAIILTKVPILTSGFFLFAFSARLDIVMLILLTVLYKNSSRLK